jgi:hypothetical protein
VLPLALTIISEAATRALDHFGFIPMIASKASPSKLIRGLFFAKQTSKLLYQVVHVLYKN